MESRDSGKLRQRINGFTLLQPELSQKKKKKDRLKSCIRKELRLMISTRKKDACNVCMLTNILTIF